MSEFKFACPVCGQHLTADPTTSGGQIECPTCFQKIVVPQAPESGETKFILSATKVTRPRFSAADAVSQAAPTQRSAPRSSLMIVAALLLLLCAAAAVIFQFGDRLFQSRRVMPPPATNVFLSPPPPPLPLNTNYPVPKNFRWTLDLTNAVFPSTPAAGRIHGSGFLCEKAALHGSLLMLDQGKTWPWDLGLALHLFVHHGEELSDKTVEIPPDRQRAPRVFLRWKDDRQQPVTQTITNGYLLRVAFGHATNAHLPGKIYICLPDKEKSFVAGTFDAEIKRFSPAKPGPTRPPGTNAAPSS